jgi:Reversibly glycosylated polypeptide
MAATVDVVLTTIGTAEVLDHYGELLAGEPVGEHVRLVVIPDRRTPWDLFRRVGELRDRGVDVVCPTVREQEDLLTSWGARWFVPADSDNRRNIGFAMAWRDGRDVVVSVDDDNYPIDAGFFATHAVVAASRTAGDVVESSSGWFNAYELLDCEPVQVWPRGFPFRHRRPATTTVTRGEATVAINAGLWLGEPDVDAATRLVVHPTAATPARGPVLLGQGTWCPVNVQNTAVRRDVLPAWWTVRMGYRDAGLPIDRYGDVIGGLFAQACAKHLGHGVRIGDPYARHLRTAQAGLDDLAAEIPAAVLLEDLAEWLVTCPLEGDDYVAAYASLSHLMEDQVERMRGTPWTDTARGFFHQVAHRMRAWLQLLERAAG